MKQQTTQKQYLAISQQLMQSLELLHMNALEVETAIISLAEQNPFIEIAPPPKIQPKLNHILSLPSYKHSDIQHVSNRPYSLKEYLIQQIRLCKLSKKEQLLAFQITEHLNAHGYLTVELEELAADTGYDKVTIEALLHVLQKLEPTGVYARTLSECLTLQLKEQNLWTTEYAILLRHLDLIARKEFAALARICRLPVTTIIRMIEAIKRLDPKPGRNFETDPPAPLLPEATVSIGTHHQIAVTFNRLTLPDIWVNKDLYNQVTAKATAEERDFYKKNYKQAQWLNKALEQRGTTIVSVTKVIVELQYEFFTQGINYLKPMTLKQVANKLGIHESTVSRVTNKCIATPFGIFPLKYFFASEIKSSIYENTYSSHAVKEKIKCLIVQEDPGKPLSDDRIALKLKGEGLIISRRTVAKYREAMKLEPSHLRKIRA